MGRKVFSRRGDLCKIRGERQRGKVETGVWGGGEACSGREREIGTICNWQAIVHMLATLWGFLDF